MKVQTFHAGAVLKTRDYKACAKYVKQDIDSGRGGTASLLFVCVFTHDPVSILLRLHISLCACLIHAILLHTQWLPLASQRQQWGEVWG